MTAVKNDKLWWILDTAIKIAVPVILGAVSFLGTKVMVNSERLTAIESNRFTASDAFTLQNQLYEKLDSIRTDIHKLSMRVPEKIPPDWFQQQVNDLHDELKINHKEIQQVHAEVESLRTELRSIKDKM